MKMVKAEGLTYEYTKIMETDHGTEENRVVALKNVNIEIEKGEFVVVLGHNGSGKSTFAKHINALLQPTGGTLWVKGMNTQEEGLIWEIRQTAGMVFQNPDNQLRRILHLAPKIWAYPRRKFGCAWMKHWMQCG